MGSSLSSSQPQSSPRALRHPQTEYQYKDLNPEKNEIRLLQILPKRQDSEAYSRVECNLFITSLDNAPEYQALSYAWNDPAERPVVGDILLEGYPFKVTPSLEHALLQLQSDAVQLFWIDALCINQRHDLERSEQVAKMRTIYQRAENVVVWLGSSSNGVSSAFSLFETLYENQMSKEFVDKMFRDKANINSFEAVLKLYRRPYWYRLWVVQEVNSAKKATVMCGRYKINWEKLHYIQNHLLSDHDRHIIRLQGEDPKLFDFSFRIRFGGTLGMVLPQTTSYCIPDLSTLLLSFWNKVASEPRDKVYALVGLSSARDDSRFVVDYSASVRQVYINVVKYIITSSEKLDIICSMMHGRNKFGLPSWVPDWTVEMSEFGAPLMFIINSNQGPQYCSAGESIAEYILKDNDRILNAKGFLLGHIRYVGLKDTTKSEPDFRTSIPILLNWLRLINVIKTPGLPKFEAFCRTIFFDRFSSQYYPYPTQLELMERLLGAIVLLVKTHCPEERIDPQWVHLSEKYKIEQWWAESWFDNACDNARCRRFFVTDADLIGISAETIEPGDLVCILLGCWVPLVLRPKDGHYILLGEAYVHGYMYGKAIEELAEGNFEVQNFEIH